MGAPPETVPADRPPPASRPGRAGVLGRRASPVVVVVAAAAWTANLPVLRAVLTDAGRALDAMDESHYLLAAQPWAGDKAFNGVFGWYSGPLLRLVGDDLGRLRVLGAVLLALAALTMARAVRRCAETLDGRGWPDWLRGLWPPAAVGAAMCYYTVFVRTPSYNWFAALGLMMLTAGLGEAVVLGRRVEAAPAGDVAARVAGRSDRVAAWVAGGLVALGLFLTAVGKASTALAALAVCVGLFVVLLLARYRWVGEGRPLWRAAGAAAGTGALLAVGHSLLVASPATTVTAYRRAAGMLAVVDPGHYAPGALGHSIRAGLRNMLLSRPEPYLGLLALPVAVALVVGWWVLVRGPGRAPSGPGLWLAGSFVVVWALVLFRVLMSYPGGVPGLGMSAPAAMVLAEAALLVGVLVALWRLVGVTARGPSTPTAVAVAGGLLLLGTAYPVGTNVEYSTQLHGAFPVLVASAVLALGTLPGPGRDLALGTVAVGALLLGAVLVPGTRENAPFRIAPLEQQTIPRAVPAGSAPLLLDAQTVAWVDDLRRLAADGGWRSATPLLDLTWHPASVLALDGRAPSVLLPAFPGWPDPAASAAHALRQEDPAVWRRAWLLVPYGQDDAIADTATGVLGRRFPADYDLRGTVVAPFDGQVQGLWRPRRPG